MGSEFLLFLPRGGLCLIMKLEPLTLVAKYFVRYSDIGGL